MSQSISQALAEARRPKDLPLMAELYDAFPALVSDATPAFIGGSWRPAIQVKGTNERTKEGCMHA